MNDTIAAGTQTVTITATLNGFADGTDSLDVTDDETAALTIVIADASIDESDGTAATITIPAGQTTSTAFEIDAVNDTIVDGTQTVTITATAANHADGSDTVDVTDDETAALTVSIAADSIGEGDGVAATTATVTRNSDTTNALTVTLTSSDISEATVAATITIPAGQTTSTAFEIDAVNDTIVDGTQTVTITATAANHADGSDTVDVTDDDVASSPAGDIDGDSDFDANDSFLIQLVKLSATLPQIDQSKGSSTLSATEIRNRINMLQNAADADGDNDFDANDAFLIHLVKLAATDQQIEQSKGSSTLSATEIKSAINGLETSPGQLRVSRRLSAHDIVVRTNDRQDEPAHNDQNQFLSVSEDDEPIMWELVEFRSWIDLI